MEGNATTSNKAKKDKVIYVPQVSELGKMQPQDLEVEEAVLGALMLERDAYVAVCDILRP